MFTITVAMMRGKIDNHIMDQESGGIILLLDRTTHQSYEFSLYL